MSFYEDRVFPVFLDLATRPFARDRAALIGRASGRVLELGVGTGANLPFYTEAAREVVGLEPCAALLEQARARAATLPDPQRITLVQGVAESLPFPDDSFDTVVACLVFCTIPDAATAAAEARRVLRPGGQFLFFEHVASTDAGTRRWQERLNPLWQKAACGCRLNCDTAEVFRAAGLEWREFDRFRHPKVLALAGTMIRGVATKP
jgi:ubiquinone/menaquinone biosynthesis C-methylase UbiE